jgi:hypothetical protein
MAIVAAVAAVGVAGSMAMQGYQMAQGAPKIPEIKLPNTTPDAVNENESQKAAEKRRRMYQGVGRSSTILTNAPLGGLDDKETRPKQLLGM